MNAPFARLMPVCGLLVIIVLVGGCVSTPTVPPTQRSDQVQTRAYGEVLKAAVRRGLVDYPAVADHSDALKQYLASLRRHGPRSTPGAFPTSDSRLAYYLNAYNATMLYRWLQAGAADGDRGRVVNKLWFITDQWKIDGRTMSLDKLEQRVIRGNFEDPRIHFALICGAMSCPPLLDEPFTGPKLNEQLDALAERWLQQPDALRITGDGQVYLSAIFKWYREDFQQMGGLTGVMKRYLPEGAREKRVLEAIHEGQVNFLDYDWSINQTGTSARDERGRGARDGRG